MKNKLNEIITELGYELYDTGSFTSAKKYPDKFFTCENFNSQVDRHYDNKDHRTVWAFWLSYYTTRGDAYEVIDLVRNKLKENGWCVPDRGTDIHTGSQAHEGRELTIYFIEEV